MLQARSALCAELLLRVRSFALPAALVLEKTTSVRPQGTGYPIWQMTRNHILQTDIRGRKGEDRLLENSSGCWIVAMTKEYAMHSLNHVSY